MPITPRSNSLSMSAGGILRVLVHFADERPDLPVGELVDAVAEQPFVVGQGRQRRAAMSVCWVVTIAATMVRTRRGLR